MKCLLISLLLLLFGCSRKEKDKDVKRSLTSTAREDVAFAGINFTVRDGVVTLGGNSPTPREKDKVVKQVNNTAGVKGVIDLIQIAPVTLTADFSLKQAADSVLMPYAMVQASVQDSIITLRGQVEKEQLPGLLKTMEKLQAKGIHQQLAQQ